MSTCYYATYKINFLVVLFEKGSETGLELKVTLKLPEFPKYWNHKHAHPYPVG